MLVEDTAEHREIFGDEGQVIMATNLSGNGRAQRVEGGFRLSGNFTYLSGCDIANWLCVGGAVEEADGSLTWYYFAIRPEKLWITKGMVFGDISREEFLQHHDPQRWVVGSSAAPKP